MRRVDIEEAAPIGAEHLDGFLRSDRSQRDLLIDALQAMRRDIGGEGLGDAGETQHNRQDQGQRQQHVQIGAHHIDPEIADTVG